MSVRCQSVSELILSRPRSARETERTSNPVNRESEAWAKTRQVSPGRPSSPSSPPPPPSAHHTLYKSDLLRKHCKDIDGSTKENFSIPWRKEVPKTSFPSHSHVDFR
ncbi:uncharacterized protein LOC118197954 [Stegodyphus dumicola]|uniref:uncharacterized protein LOC118197954 n=1 Tax=Stegodyphus dumicola TaxID=202533 RepID=UPI0015A7F100|nr:uncharacterized protein LOC118197954 [Stegodyphus dumicola]